MTPLFAPKGEKAEWLLVYDKLLADADFGTVITYAQVDEVLGRDSRSNRAPIYRARDHLADTRKRWLESVPGVGYRVTEPADHVRVSVHHRRKSKRQLGIAVKVLESTDITRLDPTGLAQWDEQQKVTFALWAIVAHEARLRKIEDILRKEGLL
jgi:hypothetical protein